jgi:tetratricopeptide (TPR) repeat protein
MFSTRARHREAERILADILAHSGDHPSPRRRATLDRLGRCYRAKQQTARAEAICRQAFTEADQLEQTEAVRQEIGYLQADLGDGLMAFGRYQDARVAHEKSLAIARVLGNDRSCAVSLGQ